MGKSTLVNRLLGEERVVVFDQPGTTRDSVYIDYERRGQRYTLIDTAGVRKRKNVREAVEKFSIVKTLKAIADAQVVILTLDAHEGIVEQDLHLLGQCIDAGRALVIALNKWDGSKPTSGTGSAQNCDGDCNLLTTRTFTLSQPCTGRAWASFTARSTRLTRPRREP